LLCISDFVDNRLLDLYGVEFGELAEATSLLTPYMMAYCHSKKHLVQKLAQELIYYGYAGLKSHFTYQNLLTTTKGLKSGRDSKANNANLMSKFFKFVKMAKAFEQASLSEPERALQFKLEDEILAEVKRDEANITDWLKKRMTSTNDWPDLCLLKDADKKERNTLVIRYQRIKQIKTLYAGIISPEKLLTNETWDIKLKAVCESEGTYVRAPKEEKVLYWTECKEQEERDNVMFVSYYPNPCCGEEKKVFVSWKKMTVCFLNQTSRTHGSFSNSCRENKGEKCMFYGTKEMLETADRF